MDTRPDVPTASRVERQMMSKQLKEEYEKARAIDAKLRADDPRLNGAVSIIHEEGTVLFYESSFAERHGDWWYIFPEHHVFLVYPEDEVQIRQYKRMG